MSNKTDLRYLAADMEVLSLREREIWLHKLSHCRIAYIQNKSVFESERNMLISGLIKAIASYPTQILKGVVKKGVNAFMLASDDEKAVFCKALRKRPIYAKSSVLLNRKANENRIYE